MNINRLIVWSPCPICGGNMHNDIDLYCVKNFDYRVSKEQDLAMIWLSPQTYTSQWLTSRILISLNPLPRLYYRENGSVVDLPFSLIDDAIDVEDFLIKIRIEVERIQKLKSFL